MVGHQKSKPLDLEKVYKRKIIINKLESSLTGTTIDDMKISEKEEQNIVEYQETLKIDVENIHKNIKLIQRPIYEVIDALFLKKRTFYHKIV